MATTEHVDAGHGDDVKSAARKTLKKSSDQIKNDSFNYAWDKFYGKKNYKPSWIQRSPKDRLPTITANSDETGKKTVVLKGDVELAHEYQVKLVEGIPIHHRTKDELKPLEISGKVVPNEKQLKKWRDVIKLNGIDSEGRPFFNKVVKDTDVPRWMNENDYGATIVRKFVHKSDGKQKKTDSKPIRGKPNLAHYDMVTKYENRMKHADLKSIGCTTLPDKRTLNRLAEQFDIPPDVGTRDYGSSVRTVNEQTETEGRKNFHAVVKQVNVPKFLDETYRPRYF
ncbi:uncharacterized protein LOC117114020 [Anneissia japonica]|uniref:uncharacterized protein LOC117114020 n=1 Tax=Anneissia japonica TaxID=1529436 RepID=UPI0014255276|nr:uncharacterized protein LOC117114020 [Anneissia japonica]XP_033113442.1 uncharacterized protein LOC117114020 [Anneissia japonica]